MLDPTIPTQSRLLLEPPYLVITHAFQNPHVQFIWCLYAFRVKYNLSKRFFKSSLKSPIKSDAFVLLLIQVI